MSIEIQTTDGYITLDHAPFAKTLAAVKALPSSQRSYNRLAKFWVVKMTQTEFLAYAEKAGVWDAKLAAEAEAYAGDLTLDEWLWELEQEGRDWHGMPDGFVDTHEAELKAGWENGWSPSEAVQTLKQAGLF